MTNPTTTRRGKKPTNLNIDRFGDRIIWMIQNLQADPELLVFPSTLKDVWSAVLRMLNANNLKDGYPAAFHALDERTWSRATAGRVPPSYVECVLRIFPEMSRSVLLMPTYEDFRRGVEHVERARARWSKAAKIFLTRRADLAALGKRYYAAIDYSRAKEFPYKDFPLIVRKGWILKRPVPIREETDRYKLPPLLHLNKGTSEVRGTLDGLNVDYRTFRSHLDRRSRNNPRSSYDGDAYCLLGVQPRENGLDLQLGLCGYYDYVNSCEILGAKLADAHAHNIGDTKSELTPRHKALSEIFDFEKRAAFVGVNCLTLLTNYYRGQHLSDHRRAKRDWFLVHLRDETTFEAQNTVHVFPSGGHAPLLRGGGDLMETQIWRTVVREFVEELFDKEYLANMKSEPEGFFEHPDVKEIIDIFFRGRGKDGPCAQIFLLGLGLDPVTTKPEILVVIRADWEAALRAGLSQKIKPNWEASGKSEDDSRIRWIELNEDNLRSEARGFRQRLNGINLPTLPAGAACMMIAAEHLPFLRRKAS